MINLQLIAQAINKCNDSFLLLGCNKVLFSYKNHVFKRRLFEATVSGRNTIGGWKVDK